MILTFLQRSVHAVLLGKTSRPDWLLCGVPGSALIDKFSVKIMTGGWSHHDTCGYSWKHRIRNYVSR